MLKHFKSLFEQKINQNGVAPNWKWPPTLAPWTRATGEAFTDKRWKKGRQLLIAYSLKPSLLFVIGCP